MTPEPNRHARRRWLRYSLRSLLVAMTIGCVAFGLWRNSAEKQRRAVAVIEEAGGFVGYDYDLYGEETPWLAHLLGRDYVASVEEAYLAGYTDAPLVAASHLRRLLWLEVNMHVLNHSRLELLADCTEVRDLTLPEADITDEGLASLEGMVHLEALSLENCQIGDGGIVHLRKLKSLKQLDLRGTHITDAGLRSLATFPNLQWLAIEDTPVTDMGLAELQSCHSLTQLYLSGSAVTDAGVLRFRKAVPACLVDYYP